jgi:hypothetical protein
MLRIRRHLSYANVMSTIAVIVAIAGGSTAIAFTVSGSKKSDINKKGNIRVGRVTAKKLADGSVVASKLGAITVVQATGLNGAHAICPPGQRLLSGGAAPDGGAGVALEESLPEGNGWRAGINSGVGNRNITVYALCLRA